MAHSHHHEHEHEHSHEHHHSHCDCCSHEHEHNHEHHHHEHSLKKQLWLIGITVILLIAAVVIEKNLHLETWQLLLVYLVPYLIIGHETLKEAVEGVVHGDAFNEHFLMSVATIGALCIGFLPGAETEFPEAVFVMLFFQVGELFEGYAEGKSRASIAHLMDIRPDVAHVDDKDVSPEAVAVGSVIVIRPGEKVPLDGVIIEGASALNTVALTGESLPREVNVGDEVISGCVNLSGVLRVRTTKAFGESTVSKIISLVENAGERKSQSETFITRFARVYTPVVVFMALALAILPPLFISLTSSLSFLATFPTWLYRALMFLVVSCPCALVISVPLTFFGGIGGASRKGILVKGANYMDVLAKVDTVVFDKTGTLTHGQFAVTAVHPELIDQRELLHMAAHVEHFSTHPIGAALRDAFPDEATDGCQVSDVEEIAGHGIRAKVGSQTVCVGNTKMMETIGAQMHDCSHCHDEHAVGTVIHVAIDGQYAGHIVINDKVKEDSADAIASLKALGVTKTVMLTGDRKEVAEKVAQQLGITEYHAELLPSDKVAQIESLLHPLPLEGAGGGSSSVAFVGDGINDAPVLARADVGIAMGGLGSDAAIEAADVVLMDDKPSKIALAIHIARRTLTIARQNVWFAIGVKVAVLLLAAFGLATMWLAVFADVGVTVLAVLNAMRALHSDEGSGGHRGFFQRRWVRFVGWLLAVLLAACVLITLLVSYCPPVQRWLVGLATDTLSKELKTEVSIGHVGLNLLRQRMTISDLCLKDQQDEDLLRVDEVSGEVRLLALLRGRLMLREFKINNMDVTLKNPADGPANYQFLIDATKKKDTIPSPTAQRPAPLKIDLRHFEAHRVKVSYNDQEIQLDELDYRNILNNHTATVEHLRTYMRQNTKKGPVDWHFDSGLVTAAMSVDGKKRVEVSGLVVSNDNHRPRHNTGKPHHGAFDAGHLNLRADLGLDIHYVGKDSVLATLTNCTASDSVAGIDLTDLQSDIAVSGKHVRLTNLVIQQVTTRLDIPRADITLPDKKLGTTLEYQADSIKGRVMLKDIAKPFAPTLGNFSIPLNLKVALSGTDKGMAFRGIQVSTDDRQLVIHSTGLLRNLDKSRELTLHFSVHDMVARASMPQKIINQFTVKKFLMNQLYALGTIKYFGEFDILWHKEKFRGLLNTIKGNINFDFQLDGDTHYVSGRASTDSLHLGELFKLKNLGTIDCSATFNIDYSKKRTAAIRKHKGGKLPIGTVEADVRSVGYRNIRLKNILANIVSDGAVAEGDVTMQGKMTDLMLQFSFTNTSEMHKMKVKPKLKFHKLTKGRDK